MYKANMSVFALHPYVFWKYVFMHMEYVILFFQVFLYFMEKYWMIVTMLHWLIKELIKGILQKQNRPTTIQILNVSVF